MASSSTEEDDLEDESPDESQGEQAVKKVFAKTERNQVKGKKLRNGAAQKKKGNIGGDGDDEIADSEVDGMGKDKVRKKANKAVHITLRGSASKVHKLFQEMSAESREKFSSCCFGHLIHMPPFTVNMTLMCAVLRRYVKWDVFDFDGYDSRCSLRDIALITGLSVTPIVNPIRYDEGRSPGSLRNRYLGTGTVTEYTLLQAIRSLESSQECDWDDLCKMHMLYFVSVFLLPNSAKNVDPNWIQLAEDLSEFNAHPWGYEVHRMLVDSFSHMFPRLGTPHFNAYGCLHVFTVWCYMHFPSLSPPIVDRVYPRLLAYKLKSRLKDKGGVGNITLKTYETKVDKCLKKKNFIVQVEVSPEERQAYYHPLPTVEDDPVRGSDTLWVPKRSAAIGTSGSNGKDGQLVSGLTTEGFKQMMDKIMERRVYEPIRELTRHVVLYSKHRGVSVDIGHSNDNTRKTTESTSEMVLRRSQCKRNASFPSTQSSRADDGQPGGAGTSRASSFVVNCNHPKKTQGDINKRVLVRQNKMMDPVVELAEEDESGVKEPKAQKTKESGPANGKKHGGVSVDIGHSNNNTRKTTASTSEMVLRSSQRKHASSFPSTQSRRVDDCQPAGAGTILASSPVLNCGHPEITQGDINKLVPVGQKKMMDHVEELDEEKEIGEEAEKTKESGPGNGKKKEELAHLEKQHENTNENDGLPSAQSEMADSLQEAARRTTRSSNSPVNHGLPETTQPDINQKVSPRKKKKNIYQVTHDQVKAVDKDIGDEEQGGEKETEPPQRLVVTGTTETLENDRSAKARRNSKLRDVGRKRKNGLAEGGVASCMKEVWDNCKCKAIEQDLQEHNARNVDPPEIADEVESQRGQTPNHEVQEEGWEGGGLGQMMEESEDDIMKDLPTGGCNHTGPLPPIVSGVGLGYGLEGAGDNMTIVHTRGGNHHVGNPVNDGVGGVGIGRDRDTYPTRRRTKRPQSNVKRRLFSMRRTWADPK